MPIQDLKRVAILGSRGFPSTYGGYETMVRYLARDWVSRGIEVTVYCRERPGRARVWEEEGVICRWTPGVESSSFSTLSFGLTSLAAAATRRYDAALVVNVANGFFLPALRLGRVPVAINTDGIEWERGKWGKTAKRVFRLGAAASARFADVTVADSQEIARIWKQTFEVDSEFIPYGAPVLSGVPTDRLENLGLEPDRFNLVVARLVPENNVDLALDALAGHEYPLVVVGSGNGESELEKRLSSLDQGGTVRWLGHVSDQSELDQLWAHCATYFHGHSVGGTNPALLQAMGAGAPVVALDTPFNREVLGNQEQLFSPDPTAVRSLAELAIKEAGLRTKWRELGQARVAERYSWPAVSEGYLQALSLAADRRGTA